MPELAGHRGADEVYGVWAGSLDELISYRYVGCQSVLLDRDHAEGWTTMRAHLRGRGSILGAPLAISMLDTAGINIDRHFHLGLTQVDIQLYEPALDVARIHTVGVVVREARTQLFTECRFEDAERPGRVIGVGASNWAVISPTPAGFDYLDPGPGLAEGPAVPPIWRAFELDPTPSGGFVLPALSARVGVDTLHHGPVLVGLEQTACRLASASAGHDDLVLRSWTTRIVKAGRRGPFTFDGAVLASGAAASTGLRLQVVDGAGEVVAVSHLAYEVRDVSG